MKISHPFVVHVLNKQDSHPLQAASDLSGEKMVEMRGSPGGEYSPPKRMSQVAINDLILPAKDTFHYMNLPEFMQIRKGARAEVVRNARNALWMRVAWKEKRADGQFARKFQLALPPDMDAAAALAAVTEFAENSIVTLGMVADLAIHETRLAGATPEDAPLIVSRTGFLMCTTRPFENGAFGNKNRQWNDRGQMLVWRKEWFATLAKHLPALEENSSQESKDLWKFAARFSAGAMTPPASTKKPTEPEPLPLETEEEPPPSRRPRL